MSKKYTEIHVLKERLREAGIPYEVQKANDGWQVGIPHLYPEESRISVIEHFASYGSAFDLLEIQFPDGEIRGFLKAETAFTLIQRIREKEHEKKETEDGKYEIISSATKPDRTDEELSSSDAGTGAFVQSGDNSEHPDGKRHRNKGLGRQGKMPSAI